MWETLWAGMQDIALNIWNDDLKFTITVCLIVILLTLIHEIVRWARKRK